MSAKSTILKQIEANMVFIKGGTYGMGEDQNHEVNIKDFYMGQFLVTQLIWETIMEDNPSNFKGTTRPVELVSWDDITKVFLPKLNYLTGMSYRLPTESEWEYAARGGVHESSYRYSGSNKLKEVGWYKRNSNGETKPVGQKLANVLGLYDMSGNVLEWCADEWQSNLNKVPQDGSPSKGDKDRRVVRGGTWFINGFICTVSLRSSNNFHHRNHLNGFRVCRY